MKFVYVHHGNRKIIGKPTEHDDLTELGEKDCNLVAELLNNPEVKNNAKAIFTAPVLRCQKTAQIINKHLNLPIYNTVLLKELDKTTENWEQAQKRIITFIENTLKEYAANDMVICVTSGVNVAGFICKAFNIPPSENSAFIGVPNCCPLIFDINWFYF